LDLPLTDNPAVTDLGTGVPGQKAKDRQATLDPEKQDPPGVLMEMERPKDSGSVLDARR
jgi:hypothetical protein